MTTIRNNTASPFDLAGKDGVVRLPAFGSVEGDFSGEYIEILRASNAVTVEEGKAKEDPKADAEDDSEALRGEYESLAGKAADKRWSDTRLKAEVDALKQA